jgi:hypothetical protein
MMLGREEMSSRALQGFDQSGTSFHNRIPKESLSETGCKKKKKKKRAALVTTVRNAVRAVSVLLSWRTGNPSCALDVSQHLRQSLPWLL